MEQAIWELQILGRASDLEHLARHFTALPVVVTKDDQASCYLLQSDSFRPLTTAQQVIAASTDLLLLLSGVLNFTRGSEEPLRSGAVFLRRADGHRDIFVHLEDALAIRSELGDVSVTVTDSAGVARIVAPPPPPSLRLVRAALTDSGVSKALRLLTADGGSWVGLYRIHEVVEADVGGEQQMIERRWGAAGQLKRFKHCANSVAAAGDLARHGKEATAPPPNPMSLDEARAYVRCVLEAWLNSKGAL